MKNRPLNHIPELEEIIRKCQVCYVGMTGPDHKPYVVPMNFGYLEGVVFLHGSTKGKKMEFLALNPEVCIAFSTDHELRYVNEEVACSWSMRYRSVLFYGRAELIEDLEEKTDALKVIMAHYTPGEFTFSLPALREVAVLKIKADKIEGRAYGY
jgi:hypothetical protein